MLFVCFITASRAHNSSYNMTRIDKASNKIVCSEMKLILNPNNLYYKCDASIYFENKNGSFFYAKEEFTIINQTKGNLADVNFRELKKTIIIPENSKLVFYEFINMTTINSIIDAFSAADLNLWMTMDWMKYSDYNSNYCQWDKASINKKLYDYFDNIARNSKWKKICVNNKAYLHYSDEFEGEIIIIPKVTFVACFCTILVIIIGIIISLFFVAKCCTQTSNRKTIYPEDNSDSNEMSQNYINPDSVNNNDDDNDDNIYYNNNDDDNVYYNNNNYDDNVYYNNSNQYNNQYITNTNQTYQIEDSDSYTSVPANNNVRILKV